MDIIGRQFEIQQLRDIYGSGEAELAIVYGRRRVGKTFLVRECFRDKLDFTFTGVYKKPAETQLTLFAAALAERSGESVKPLNDWYEAFAQLKQYLQTIGHKRRADREFVVVP